MQASNKLEQSFRVGWIGLGPSFKNFDGDVSLDLGLKDVNQPAKEDFFVGMSRCGGPVGFTRRYTLRTFDQYIPNPNATN